MTLLQSNAVQLTGHLSGNHVIARQSHEATTQSLAHGEDTSGRMYRSKAERLTVDRESKLDSLRPQDSVDEALIESFPASDPPGFYCCHA